jgi:hypothetical protein
LGYTHYYPQQRDFTPDEFANLGEAARKIIAAVELPLAWEYDEPKKPPQIDLGVIRFNGVGDDGHETFYLPRVNERPEWSSERRGDVFRFTKTAYKPYDLVVTAILIAADAIAPGALAISSDGGPNDWQAGLALASHALPALVSQVPAGVHD